MLRIHSNRRFATMDDFQFPASTLQSTVVPAIAGLPDGGFVTVWTRSVSGTQSIVAQIHNRNGRAVDSEFVVGPGSLTPSVAPLAGGGFVVNWTTNGVVQGRIYDATGDAIGTQFTANTTPNGVQATSQVAALAGGGFVIAWRDPHNGTFDNIRGQVFAANGTKIGGEFIGGDAVAGVEDHLDIVALSGGGYVVSWYQTGGDSSFGYGARAQVFDASGTKLGAAFTLNTITQGTQQTAELAALPSGGFVAVWTDDGNTMSGEPNNGNQGVWAQLFDASGNKVGEDIHVDAGSGMADVEVIPGVGFAVVWKELSDPSSETYGRLRIQTFDFDGNRTGDEFSVAPHLQSIQNLPDITALASGALVVSWLNWVPQAGQENPRATIFFATKRGTADADIMVGTADRDFHVGLGGPDQLTGGGEDDGLEGGDGNDFLDGGVGGDALYGGTGNDRLFGGDGVDLLVGGSGTDRQGGGTGTDIFRFETAGDSRGYILRSDGKQLKPDVIVDFFQGLDKIDLSAIDANAGTAANDAFAFIGSAAFTNQAGQLRAVTANGMTSIFADIDGNGSADLHIVVLGPDPLFAFDFVL
jgi:hypothetical protein